MEARWLCRAATLRGDRSSNQDQVVLVDGAAAVLDGATSWLRDPDDPRDGGWYSRVLGAELTARLPAPGASLAAVLADAIAAVRDAHALTPGDSPYSTASIVRWSADTVEVLVLGDSPAAVRPVTGPVEVVADPRLSTTAADERAAYRRHLAGGAGFDDRFGRLMAAVQRAERAAFNRDGGFWVAEADPVAAQHAITRSWPADQIDVVALLSDGAAAAVTDYELVDWPGLVDELTAAGDWLARLHAIEASDPAGQRWARTKRHDDKSVALLSRIA